MAICKLNDNWLRTSSCGYQLGAITMIYAVNASDIETTTIDTTDGQEVSGITFATGAEVYQLEPARNSASWSDTLVVNDNGTKYRTHLVAFNLLGNYSKEQADVVDAISLGKYVIVVAKADGGYVMLGRLNGLEATVATIGGSENDSVPNGLQVSMEANQAEVALPLSAEAVTALLAKKKRVTPELVPITDNVVNSTGDAPLRLRVIYTKNPMDTGDQAFMTFYVGAGLDQENRLDFESTGWPPSPTVGGPASLTYEPECANVYDGSGSSRRIVGSDIVINDLHGATTFVVTSRTMVEVYQVV